MSEFKTPGVFINEVSRLPPSVVQVETAIPSFIGYTEKALENGENLTLVPKKISSLLEYETYFGVAKKESIKLKNTVENELELIKPTVDFLMYYSLQMYFANGGGPCYIISVGNYSETVDKTKLSSGLVASEEAEDSTLVLFPDAISLTDPDEYHALYQEAIDQAELKNRFAILDTYKGDSKATIDLDGTPVNAVDYLREKNTNSIHAAAYFPHLKTVLNYSFDETATIEHSGLQPQGSPQPFYTEAIAQLTTLKNQADTQAGLGVDADENVIIDILEQAIAVIENVNETADDKVNTTDAQEYLNDMYSLDVVNPSSIATDVANLITDLLDVLDTTEDIIGDANNKTLSGLKTSNSSLYYQIKKAIESVNVILPPSSIMAGIYSKTDATKGVWKAPANVGLNYVVAPTEKISDKEQETLNDHGTGKSVNAIRTFAGKGTLVWGSRTFDSNDTEWRYVAVRRLFDMVEKSLQNATQTFVFNPNEANTWVRVKAMIENYLNQLWLSGALAGSKPEQAYYVSVGLNETMTEEDINAGIMNIEIGMAAVRPAEFIVLNFSHKLQ